MRKLYCFVDENGLETRGRIFIVALIAFTENAATISDECAGYEHISGKGKTKWGKAEHSRRLAYLKHTFKSPTLNGYLHYAVFYNTQDYESSTLDAIARTVRYHSTQETCKAVIYVDALSKTKRHTFGNRLRKAGISTHKVQGITKDENNPLVRLADAIAGFVRDALDNEHSEITDLFQEAIRSGVLVEV